MRKRVLVVLGLVNSVYLVPAFAQESRPLECTEIAADHQFGFDMTGKERLYPNQVLQRQVAAEDGTTLTMIVTTDGDELHWARMRDGVCFRDLAQEPEPIVCPAPPENEPLPSGPVYYGPDEQLSR